MVRFFSLLIACLNAASASCWAKPDNALVGYVVKVEDKKVFLDLNLSSGIRPGQSFTVFSEGEMLKHPVTRIPLGPIETTVATGTIVEAHETYSLGQVPAPMSALHSGQKARINTASSSTSAQPPASSESAAIPANNRSEHAPYYRSPMLDIEAIGLAIAGPDAAGVLEVTVADKNTVQSLRIQPGDAAWTPVCSFKDTSTSPQILSIEAAGADLDGASQILVTLNNQFFNRIESYLLACKSGTFFKKAAYPWMAASFSEPGKPRGLASQQLLADGSFPLSPIYRLEYVDGQFRQSKERVAYKHLDWLYGFGLASAEEPLFPVFYNRGEHIQLQFKKNSWSTPESFGQTSNRVRWYDKVFSFHPRLALDQGPSGLSVVYSLKNIPRFGSLAETFGLFNHSELHCLRFNGISLDPDWKFEIGGYSPNLAPIYDKAGKLRDLAVAVVGAGGKTSIWFFHP